MAEGLDAMAMRQAERGHMGRAVALEECSQIQRAEMFGDAMRGPCMMGPPVGAVIAAETGMLAGAAVGGVVMAEEAAMARRREAEMMGLAAGCMYPVDYMPASGVYVQPGMPAAYPPGAYNPAGAGFPPTVYPQPGYQGYPAPGYPVNGFPGAGYPPY